MLFQFEGDVIVSPGDVIYSPLPDAPVRYADLGVTLLNVVIIEKADSLVHGCFETFQFYGKLVLVGVLVPRYNPRIVIPVFRGSVAS
jgi:hypothetical protein